MGAQIFWPATSPQSGQTNLDTAVWTNRIITLVNDRWSADRSANSQLGSDMGRQEHGGNADKAVKKFGFA
ncbi:hypothetical protein OAT72_07540, partial [Alphaproteobacteria bacterium]|nr:hypothetical protein [Alphaproteobacteria bacterium]